MAMKNESRRLFVLDKEMRREFISAFEIVFTLFDNKKVCVSKNWIIINIIIRLINLNSVINI